MSDNGFRFGDWQIDPDSNTLRNGDATSTVEPKAMDVLRYLCRHAGAVIPPEELLQACWGNAELGDNPIHKAITQLRRALGDSASEPRYIETVRKRGYRAIAPVMAGEDALEGSWQQGSPFRGLESFQESHAAIFFGRMQATAQLRELVLRQASDGCAMALVLGPSGSGKTSLVRAGLLPGLMASRTGSGEPVALACTLYMDCADLADGNLFQALAAVLMDAEGGGKLLFTGENAEGLGRWLESSDAETIGGRLAEASGRIKIGLFVDRLEAIFRAPGVTDELRIRFIAVLEHLARSKAVLVMLACRNDFYPEVIALPALMALKSRGGHFDLNPPDGAEIAQMVRMPAKVAGLKFEVDPATGASLDDVLCDAARGSPDTLPLLQYCLDELYRQRSGNGELLVDVFTQLGGIEGAIAVRAEQVVAGLSAAQSAALPQVLSLIVDVAEIHGAVTARRAAKDLLTNAEARELVQALVEARLFVSELSGNIPCFGLAHEALLRRWPRVSEWIEQHRSALQLRTRVAQDAEKWVTLGCPRDLLLSPGIRVNQAAGLLTLEGFSLTANERDYIIASQRRARFGERLRLAITITIGLLAILAAVLGVTAKRSQTDAEQHRAEAEGLMSYMLGNFTEKLRPIGKLELLEDISQKALNYLSNTDTQGASTITQVQRVKTLHLISDINISRNRPEISLRALETSRNILAELGNNDISSKEVIKLRSENSFYFGQIYLNKNDLGAAERHFVEYKKFADLLSSFDNSDPNGWLEQSYSLSNLGTVAMRRGELQQAASYFQQSVLLKRRVLNRDPTTKNISMELANSLSWLGSVESRQGNFVSAAKNYQELKSLLIAMQDKAPADTMILRLLANALSLEADVYYNQGKIEIAKQNLIQSEKILLDLANTDTTNKNWEINLLRVQLRLIDLNSAETPATDTLKKLASIRTKIENLIEIDPRRTELNILNARAQYHQASFLTKTGNINDAREFIKKSLATFELLHSNNKNDTSMLAYLAEAMLVNADISEASNSSEAMLSQCRKTQEIIKPVLNNRQDYWLLAPYVRANICTGDKEKVHEQIKILEKMNYLDRNHMQYISRHTNKKG